MTPAKVAGINFPFRNCKDIREQPFEITASIPILETVRPVKRRRANKPECQVPEKQPATIMQMRVK